MHIIFYAYISFQILCHVCDAEQASCLYEQPLLYMNSNFKMTAMLMSFDTGSHGALKVV